MANENCRICGLPYCGPCCWECGLWASTGYEYGRLDPFRPSAFTLTEKQIRDQNDNPINQQ